MRSLRVAVQRRCPSETLDRVDDRIEWPSAINLGDVIGEGDTFRELIRSGVPLAMGEAS